MQETENADSIITDTEEYLDTLTTSHDSTQLIAELIIRFRHKSTPPPNQGALVPVLESFIAQVLLLLAEYVLMTRNKSPDKHACEKWLIDCLTFEKTLANFRRNTPSERFFAHMQCYKILILLCAMKSHVQQLVRKEPSLIVSSVYQFACTLQEYSNYEAFINSKLKKSSREPVLYNEASALFYDVQKKAPKNNWAKCITQIINHTIGAIMVGTEFAKEDTEFLSYVVGCLADNKPTDPRMKKYTVSTNFDTFKKNILAEIARGLLSGNCTLSPYLQNVCTVFGRLKFLQTQLQSTGCEMLVLELNEVSTKLRLHLPFLLLQQYFSRSTERYHLGVDPLIYTEFTENGMLKTLLQRICVATEPQHLRDLITFSANICFSDEVDTFLIKHLHLYLMMDYADDKKPFRDAIEKIELDENKYKTLRAMLKKKGITVKEKIAARFKLLLKTGIDTLKILFSDNENKKDVVNAFLDDAKFFFADWETLCFPMVFFMVCKKALELNDPELTPRLRSVLDDYYYTISGLPRPEQKKKKSCVNTNIDNQSLDKLVATLNSSKKKKSIPSHHAKSKKSSKTRAAKTKINLVEANEIPAASEPPPPSPTLPSPPNMEPEDSTVKITSTLVTEPKPVVTLKRHLTKKLEKYVSWEKLSEQDKNAKIKTRSHFNPLERFMALFNPNAKEENGFKFALFLFGSAQHRQRYFSYSVFANDIDLRANCTLEELETFLKAYAAEFKFSLHPVYGKHPIIKIKFEEDPSVVIDISPMRNAENRDLPLHTLIKQLQAVTDFPENSVFSTIVDDEEIFIDTQGGLSCLSAKNRELRLVTHDLEDDTIPFTLLRAIRFVAKCPDYKFHATLLTWIQHNKSTVSTSKKNPQAITISHAFVKMLYSGSAARCLTLLKDLDLLKTMCPTLDTKMSGESKERFISWVEKFDAELSQTFQQRPFNDYANVCREIIEIFGIKLDTLNGFLNNSLWNSSSTIYTSLNTQPGEQNGIREKDRRSDFGAHGTK